MSRLRNRPSEPTAINQTARIYLDERKLFTDQYNQDEEEYPRGINQEAVKRYEEYFEKMMKHNTFQLELNNGNEYYVFSKTNSNKWIEDISKKPVIQATKFLDKIHMENLTVHSIVSIKDVTDTVISQYKGQKELIFDSFHIVNEIMRYQETPFVDMMIDYVLDSRREDETKRRLWRIVNEQYYGLDIHPLMEYEMDELEKILYYCEHPEEQSKLKWNPILRKGAISTAGAVIGWAAYSGFIK